MVSKGNKKIFQLTRDTSGTVPRKRKFILIRIKCVVRRSFLRQIKWTLMTFQAIVIIELIPAKVRVFDRKFELEKCGIDGRSEISTIF